MSLKLLREALCRQQSDADQWPSDIASAVDVLIDMIDKHRPVDAAGIHGNMHTATCGCDRSDHDYPATYEEQIKRKKTNRDFNEIIEGFEQ